MKCRLIISVFLLSIFLLRCSSIPTHQTFPLQLVFTNYQHLELEPCGCSLGPSGGLHRQWNFLHLFKEKSDVLYFVSGTSFVPLEGEGGKQGNAVLALKSRALLEAYQGLGVSALAINTPDLMRGQENLKK